jgi:hypothetical protein
MRFDELNIRQIANAIERLHESTTLEVLEQVMIPEADILLCKYQGKRVNLKVDLDYGACVDAVDKTLKKEDLAEIEKLILSGID